MSIISKVLSKISIEGGRIVEKKFNRITKNCGKVNAEVLYKILKQNCKSEIGEKFDFEHIKSIKDFKEQVPLTDYGYYENYIERMANGERIF